MDDKRNTVKRIQDAAKQVFGKYPVILAYLYGSEARGEATTLSDIDIALVVKDRLPPAARLQLELALEVELASIHPGDYDVRIINEAPLVVKAEVIQTGALLFAEADDARVDFEASTRHAYFDFLPVLRFHSEAYLDAQRASLREKGLL
ncbi:MAG: nucleotidyltransferase domain-containing protein [Acidobacteria bacterium]|nr:nucleotidyltransferase domain-containing protein [Acidobacteriota bacterium]MCI0622431.1 nucleotidyltransferase domain-containing protein [Acidobacteriota bacterium]